MLSGPLARVEHSYTICMYICQISGSQSWPFGRPFLLNSTRTFVLKRPYFVKKIFCEGFFLKKETFVELSFECIPFVEPIFSQKETLCGTYFLTKRYPYGTYCCPKGYVNGTYQIVTQKVIHLVTQHPYHVFVWVLRGIKVYTAAVTPSWIIWHL